MYAFSPVAFQSTVLVQSINFPALSAKLLNTSNDLLTAGIKAVPSVVTNSCTCVFALAILSVKVNCSSPNPFTNLFDSFKTAWLNACFFSKSVIEETTLPFVVAQVS